MARVNSDLVGKFVNIASRAAGFVTKRFDGRLADGVSDVEPAGRLLAEAGSIAAAYEAREYAKALRDVMALADLVNAYVDANKPWELARQANMDARLHEVCTVLINAFRLLAICMKPVLPKLAEKCRGFPRRGSR